MAWIHGVVCEKNLKILVAMLFWLDIYFSHVEIFLEILIFFTYM